MKFRFPLQKALDWTEVEESSVRIEISRLMKDAERLTARCRELEANIQALLGAHGKTLSLEWAPYVSAKIPSDAKEIQDVGGRLKVKEAEIGVKKTELNRLLLKRKGLESLKDKRRKDYRMLEGRKDQKRLDDNYQILKLRVKNG